MNGNTGKKYQTRVFLQDVLDNMRDIKHIRGKRAFTDEQKAKMIREKNYILIKRRALLLSGEDRERAERTMKDLQKF